MKILKFIPLVLLLVLIVSCTQPVEDTTEETSPPEVVENPYDDVTEPVIEPETQQPAVVEITPETDIEPEIVEQPITATQTVKITKTGFEPKELTVKVGDTVEWTNVREGNLKLAQVVGSRQCTAIKSPVLKTGETFSHTFDKVEECVFVDTITINQVMTVIVE